LKPLIYQVSSSWFYYLTRLHHANRAVEAVFRGELREHGFLMGHAVAFRVADSLYESARLSIYIFTFGFLK
jgi:hypothetical protein